MSVEWSMEDVECPLLPFVSRSSPSTFMYINLSVAYIRRNGLSLLLTRPNTTVSVAYVSEAPLFLKHQHTPSCIIQYQTTVPPYIQ